MLKESHRAARNALWLAWKLFAFSGMGNDQRMTSRLRLRPRLRLRRPLSPLPARESGGATGQRRRGGRHLAEEVKGRSISPVRQLPLCLLEAVLAVEGGALRLRLGNERFDVREEVLRGGPDKSGSMSNVNGAAQSVHVDMRCHCAPRHKMARRTSHTQIVAYAAEKSRREGERAKTHIERNLDPADFTSHERLGEIDLRIP